MDSVHRPKILAFLTAVLVVAVLYFGRAFFIPLALAALFTLLLNPLVKLLQRIRIPRVPAVVLVTLGTFSMIAVVLWLLGGELANLANELPNHRQNIHKRVQSLQKIGDNSVLLRLRQLAGEVSQSASSPDTRTAPPPGNTPPPQPAGESPISKAANMILPTVAEGLGTAALVVLFVLFMLLRLEDISQRSMRLVGFSRLTLTTKVMEEATNRVGHYLLMQGTVNLIYGVLLASALALMGLPYVILWGALATIFRFIPYVGPWIVAVLPFSLSLAVFEGWTMPLMVGGTIAGLELLTNMVLEPVLYGKSAGVMDFSLLVAIAFWTWIWGGVGLVLATPLTVCIVVFCKYIPSLQWVDVLMGDTDRNDPHLTYFQRHLANDEPTAQMLIDTAVRRDGLAKAVDDVVIPAVALTRLEEVSGNLTPVEAEEIYISMRAAFASVTDAPLPEVASGEAKESSEGEGAELSVAPDQPPPPAAPNVQVLAGGMHGEADALALDVIARLVAEKVELDTTADFTDLRGLIQQVKTMNPAALCISALPPRSQFAVSTLCRRLRNSLPHLKILVCRWNLPGRENDPAPLLAAGATWVADNVHEVRRVLEGLANGASRAA
jgi:predicted PurR-regulated permease PerM